MVVVSLANYGWQKCAVTEVSVEQCSHLHYLTLEYLSGWITVILCTLLTTQTGLTSLSTYQLHSRPDGRSHRVSGVTEILYHLETCLLCDIPPRRPECYRPLHRSLYTIHLLPGKPGTLLLPLPFQLTGFLHFKVKLTQSLTKKNTSESNNRPGNSSSEDSKQAEFISNNSYFRKLPREYHCAKSAVSIGIHIKYLITMVKKEQLMVLNIG